MTDFILPLTQGRVAVLDWQDRALAKHTWYAYQAKTGVWYALRRTSLAEGCKTFLLHREVLGFCSDDPMVDHIDGDGLNCRRSNLRESDNVRNARNRSGAQKNNHSSGVLGVDWSASSKKWRVRIRVPGRRVHVGYFSDLSGANRARLDAERRLWGVEPRRAAAHQERAS